MTATSMVLIPGYGLIILGVALLGENRGPVRDLAERAYFLCCQAFGWVLRSAKYANVRIVHEGGEARARKRRRFYAPLVVWLARPLVGIMDGGVRILPQREWEEREQRMYQRLRGTAIRVDGDGLVLPYLPGKTLAALLEDPRLEESARMLAIERAVDALWEFHHLGFTHADAMAENVMIDLGTGVARLFDFETVHDPGRSVLWRRADDVRALLVSCLTRTVPARRAGTLHLILDVYGDAEVAAQLARTFSSVLQRPLAIYLSQAPLSLPCFRQIGSLLRERAAYAPRVETEH